MTLKEALTSYIEVLKEDNEEKEEKMWESILANIDNEGDKQYFEFFCRETLPNFTIETAQLISKLTGKPVEVLSDVLEILLDKLNEEEIKNIFPKGYTCLM